jgi:uncharacterized OB-fold protein
MSDMRPEAEFTAHLAQGKFMVQRSRETGRCFFHPRIIEPGTGSSDLEWVEVSGEGTVYSTTAVSQKPPAQAFNVALVDLAEGPRMMSRIEGIPAEKVTIGMKVRARIVHVEGQQPFVVFDPA